MALFEKKQRDMACATAACPRAESLLGLGAFDQVDLLDQPQHRLYDGLRLAIPVIDAGIGKIIRLVGNCQVTCGNPVADEQLAYFLANVSASGTGRGIRPFLDGFLGDLLTYGNAAGEIVLTGKGREIHSLLHVPLSRIGARRGANGLDVELFARRGEQLVPLDDPQRVLFAALQPRAGAVLGRPLLEGLPFLANILVKIFQALEKNVDRLGNVRFAVTYKPGDNQVDRAYAKERAQTIAKEWSEAMRAGSVKDFVAVGDVDIKVIGADNQELNTQVPVRQLLEQIVAKLGIPPYLLGLSWSTTERMSGVQADMLTSELMSYQNLLTPVILQIARLFLRLNGFGQEPRVEWPDINLQDQVEGANARLLNARAKEMEQKGEQADGNTKR